MVNKFQLLFFSCFIVRCSFFHSSKLISFTWFYFVGFFSVLAQARVKEQQSAAVLSYVQPLSKL